MIAIKAWFSGWQPVNREHALKFAKTFYSTMTNIREGKRTAYINSEHIRGVVFTDAELRDNA